MKRIASITCLIFTLSLSFAQGYDWVKTLHGTSTAGIGHMMLDGYGNIYLNGGSRLDLMLDTLTVWPLQANNGYAEPVNSMMKISPDGDLVWSKQLYGHNELVNQSWPSVLNMKMSGDTSATLLIDFFFPSQPR